ncbi:PREDICTED: nuclear nucleic acid-binding protein C1D [Bactrocera latifrons]|uniref:Nuclear nucleic acid-binding protein C1D n=1 Tax=Bactrocera latifrons TaxID=174628 RepID=A0A0K8V1N3_BACLA|nr:PREDICTED: nuclear nucleic acid-binding protein C1D [Bactrocera latifrons]XP_018787316.1 PREDICTED: nuclear nucleic acid-binding protein C1D [Bactrocera latifrons]XP_018787317.1 PREDICTED: nuclear nucleic acid-binding protein C1D [Bactrocera latifrons]
MDFGELRNDDKFTKTVNNFSSALDKIEKSLSTAVDLKDFDELSTQEKVKLDNYLAYAINSLYWMHVKLRGDDPNEHGIKNELSRVRQTIVRDKQIYEHNTIRPVIDKAAAGRFIKHGLHVRFDEDGERLTENSSNNEMNKDTVITSSTIP